MKRLILALALCGPTLAAQAESYTIDDRHTFPSFEVSHLGFSTMRGRFEKTTGMITLDPQKKTGTAEIMIDAGSVTTGVEKLDEHLRTADFLDVAKHPKIEFKGTKFGFDGDKLATVGGDLTLHGVTKPVTLTVKHFKCGEHPVKKVPMCGADAYAAIKRSDFGMNYGVPAIGDDVTLEIQVEAMATKKTEKPSP